MKFHVFFMYGNMASCMYRSVLIYDTYMNIHVDHKCLVLPPRDLEILFHVLTDNFDLAVKSLSKLVNDEMCILLSEVVKDYWDFEAYQTLQVTEEVSSADKPACDVVVVTGFGTLRLTFNKRVTADVAASSIIILFLLASAEALHRPICPENRHDLCFPHDESVRKLGERVLFDFHHGLLVKVIIT